MASYIGPVKLQDAAVATGVGNKLHCAGYFAACLQIQIETTATVTFQGTVNGSDWFTIVATPVGGGADVTTAAATGAFKLSIAGYRDIRANITAWTAGTVNVWGLASSS